VGFLRRAVAWFAEHGVTVEAVMTDNGACYRSRAFAAAAADQGIALTKTRPYRPQTNGKVERFNLTLKHEWAWQRPYTSTDERTQALPDFLHRYNHHRHHGGLKGATPMAQLHNLPGKHN